MKLSAKKKKVAVIFGGTGPEHSISVKSAENLIKALSGTDCIPIPVYISKSGRWTLYPFCKNPSQIERGEAFGLSTYPVRIGCKRGFLVFGKVLSTDGAIPILHGVGGEDGVVQGALECAGISYLGASAQACALCHNKAYTKTFAEALGIPTAPWLYTECGVSEREIIDLILRAEEKLGYPMFIKPAAQGSSLGCSAVYSRADFAPAYRAAYKISDGRVLIERMLKAPSELEVAYFGSKCNEIFTNPGQISYDGGFYSYEKKYSDTSEVTVSVSSDLTESEREEIREYSKSLVRALGVRHLCRIDYFKCGGKIYFNEINTMPGMTGTSLYPALLANAGISEGKMAEEFLSLALGV